MSAVVFPLVVFAKYTTAIASKIIDTVHQPITSTPSSRAKAKKSSPCPAKVPRRSPSTTSLTTEPVYADSTAAVATGAAAPKPPAPSKRVSFVPEDYPEEAMDPEVPVPSPEMIDSMEAGYVYVEGRGRVRAAEDRGEPGDEDVARRGWYEPATAVDIKGKQPMRGAVDGGGGVVNNSSSSSTPSAVSPIIHPNLPPPPPLPLRRSARLRFICKLMFAPIVVLRYIANLLQRLIFGVSTIASDRTGNLIHAAPEPPLMRVIVGERTGLLKPIAAAPSSSSSSAIVLPNETVVINKPAPPMPPAADDDFSDIASITSAGSVESVRLQEDDDVVVESAVTPVAADTAPTPTAIPPVTVAPVVPAPIYTLEDGTDLLIDDAPVVTQVSNAELEEAAAVELPESCASSVCEVPVEPETITVEVTVNADIEDVPEVTEDEPLQVEQAPAYDRVEIDAPVLCAIPEEAEESDSVPPTPVTRLPPAEPMVRLSEEKPIADLIVETAETAAAPEPEAVVESPEEAEQVAVPDAAVEAVKEEEPAKPAEVVADERAESPAAPVEEEEAPVVAEEAAQVVAKPEAVVESAETAVAAPAPPSSEQVEVVQEAVAEVEVQAEPVVEAVEAAKEEVVVVEEKQEEEEKKEEAAVEVAKEVVPEVVAEEPAVVEAPAVVEVPAVVEAPVAVEEAPVAAEEPIVVEAPAAAEKPVVEETPAVVEAPAAVEAPVAEETPAVVEAPVAVEKPAVAEAPVAADEPAAVEVPVAVETPASAPVEPAAVETVAPAPVAVEAKAPEAPVQAAPVAAPTDFVPNTTIKPTEKPASIKSRSKRMSWLPGRSSASIHEEEGFTAPKPKRTWTFSKKDEAASAPTTPAATDEKKPLVRRTTFGFGKKEKEAKAADSPLAAPKLEKRMSWIPKPKLEKTKSSTSGASTPADTSSIEGDKKESKKLGGLFRRKDKLPRSESTTSVDQTRPAFSAATPPLVSSDVVPTQSRIPRPAMPPSPPQSINEDKGKAVNPSELSGKLESVSKAPAAAAAPAVVAVEEKKAEKDEKAEKAKKRWGGVRRAMTVVGGKKK